MESASLSTVAFRLAGGRLVHVPAEIADRFRGVDAGQNVVVAVVADPEMTNPDGSEYLYGLTPCCFAAVSCDEYGTTYCKSCYHEADPSLGGPAVLHEAVDRLPPEHQPEFLDDPAKTLNGREAREGS